MSRLTASIACYNLCLDFLSSKNMHRTVTTMKSEFTGLAATPVSRQHLITALRLDSLKSSESSVLERLVEQAMVETEARISSASQRNKASEVPRPRRESSELLIEDNIESESVLGRGLEGVIEHSTSRDGSRFNAKPRAAPGGRVNQSGRGLMMSSGGLMDDQFSRRAQRPSSGRPGSARQTTARQAPSVDILGPDEVTAGGEELRGGGQAATEVPEFLQPSSGSGASPCVAAGRNKEEDEATRFNRMLLEQKARMAEKLARGRQNWYEFDDLRGRRGLGQRPPPEEPAPAPAPAPAAAPVPRSEPEEERPRTAPRRPPQHVTPPKKARGLDLRTAMQLKGLIFGSGNLTFNEEWRLQSLSFADQPPELRFGLVQKRGGPCGILAAVQAEILRQLLFVDGAASIQATAQSFSLRVSNAQRSEALVHAIARILWRCGEKERAVLAVPSMRNQFQPTPKCRSDGITESLELYDFDKLEELEDYVMRQSSQFEMDSSPGVVLLLYSAILSRGVSKCIADMDNPNIHLMAAHGYCSQEMVSLLLIGRCISNVFNDGVEIDGLHLKGIPSRADIGLLSLHEHYHSCEVGSFYKTPRFPVWLICAESHFSVLFAARAELVSDWKAERRFDLFYYDGLAKQDEEIRLTIDNSRAEPVEVDDEDLIPPLELCIRTKWPDAAIDWNGTDPIL